MLHPASLTAVELGPWTSTRLPGSVELKAVIWGGIFYPRTEYIDIEKPRLSRRVTVTAPHQLHIGCWLIPFEIPGPGCPHASMHTEEHSVHCDSTPRQSRRWALSNASSGRDLRCSSAMQGSTSA